MNDVIDGELNYMVVHYTVNGKMLETDQYEIDISDTTFLSIIVENGYIPNNQETDDYFIVSVYGIVLPYILEEPFTQKVKSKRRNNKGNRANPNRFFERIIHIKKTQTKVWVFFLFLRVLLQIIQEIDFDGIQRFFLFFKSIKII